MQDDIHPESLKILNYTIKQSGQEKNSTPLPCLLPDL